MVITTLYSVKSDRFLSSLVFDTLMSTATLFVQQAWLHCCKTGGRSASQGHGERCLLELDIFERRWSCCRMRSNDAMPRLLSLPYTVDAMSLADFSLIKHTVMSIPSDADSNSTFDSSFTADNVTRIGDNSE